jgi:hypothetical protein
MNTTGSHPSVRDYEETRDRAHIPSDESLGYCRTSLRDEDYLISTLPSPVWRILPSPILEKVSCNTRR